MPTLLSLFLDPRQFQGDSIGLKPLKFELLLSLYLLTLACVARYLPAGLVRKRSNRMYAGVVVAATVLEMLWIGAAAALGTYSHFNVSSPLWQMLYACMGVSAVILTTASLVYGVCIWRQNQTELAKPLQTTVASGLILTFVMTLLSGTRRNSVAWLIASAYSLTTLGIFLVSLKGLPIVPLG